MKKACMIAALALCLVIPATASAKTLKNKFGVGGEVGAAVSGLSLKYWFGPVGLQLITGIESSTAENANEGSLWFDIGFRVLGNIARAANTNLFAGAGFLLRVVDLANVDSEVNKDIEILIGVEHFFGDHFSIYGRVDLRIALDETRPGNNTSGSSVTFGRGQTMGAAGGFTFYF